jgi:hypothetical protein
LSLVDEQDEKDSDQQVDGSAQETSNDIPAEGEEMNTIQESDETVNDAGGGSHSNTPHQSFPSKLCLSTLFCDCLHFDVMHLLNIYNPSVTKKFVLIVA